METSIKSIRPFVGAKNLDISRSFYKDFGFEEVALSPNLFYFRSDGFGFYLQDAYVKDWVDNSMLFLEVENLEHHLKTIKDLALDKKYDGVRVSEIHYKDWGKEYFVHDPSGILWHIGTFHK
ncbi:MAG: glyoxalase [Lutimonas sp.]